MATKPKPKRIARIVEAQGFLAEFGKFAQSSPGIIPKLVEFRRCKLKIPPERLPAAMNDHKLDGPLSAFKECHLAPNVLLLYTHDNDVVRLCAVCTHADLYAGRAGRLVKVIRARVA